MLSDTVLRSDVPSLEGMDQQIRDVHVIGDTMVSGTIIFEGEIIDAIGFLERVEMRFAEHGWIPGALGGDAAAAMQVFSKDTRVASVHVRRSDANLARSTATVVVE